VKVSVVGGWLGGVVEMCGGGVWGWGMGGLFFYEAILKLVRP